MATFDLPADIPTVVSLAIAEDVGEGDLTAALLDPEARLAAEVRLREPAILCGTAWFDEVFRQLDPDTVITWHRSDADACPAGTIICRIDGHARPILTGERTALNFLQMLSGTATATREYCEVIAGTSTKILDTRKTIPGLRLAQKYAVRCGGGENHRIGLFDAVLIKENHVAAAGSISKIVDQAKHRFRGVPIVVEVETMAQLEESLDTAADRIMLDEFSLSEITEAVRLRDAHSGARVALEVSGSVTLDSVRAVAETGVEYVSVGSITKHLRATDLSMRFV
jgi:nicotinate-nucleotide pyrophosphorylase (carboxylating)